MRQRTPENIPQSETHQSANRPEETGVKIDGLTQVVEMLKYADPAFRESLLKRITQRDPKLAQNLRRLFR